MKYLLQVWKLEIYSTRKIENLKIFQRNGKLKIRNPPDEWKIEKSFKRMENLKIFQKDEKSKNNPEGWKI